MLAGRRALPAVLLSYRGIASRSAVVNLPQTPCPDIVEIEPRRIQPVRNGFAQTPGISLATVISGRSGAGNCTNAATRTDERIVGWNATTVLVTQDLCRSARACRARGVIGAT